MILDYDLGNPAAAAAAMMLFGDDSGYTAHERPTPQVFESFSHHQPSIDDVGCGFGAITDFFPQPAPLTVSALFSPPSSSSSSSCHQRYGLALPPAPTMLGLNLGVRTYFSSGGLQPEEVGLTVGRVRRRTRTARCQAEGCGADLTHAKHYHRRHKVCEFHSKASIVIAAGLSQRFCQQCSRFHVLAEFDQGKRSCRKRLADHNRRRRKSQDLTATTINAQSEENNINNTITSAISTADTVTTIATQKPEMVLFSTTSSSSTTTPALFTGSKLDNESTMNNNFGIVSPPTTPLPTFAPQGQMALGLGLVQSSSSIENSPPSITFLSQFGGNDQQRFAVGWEEAEDGSSLRGFFHCK